MPLILSNPHNRLQSELEIKEWERQRDAKSEDLPQIGLSCKEKRLLKQSTKDFVLVTEKNKKDAYRLIQLDFVRVFVFDSGRFNGKEAIVARARGINYLSYLKMKGNERKASKAHDLLMVVIGALAGGLITYAFEHLRDILSVLCAKQ